jgi:hypothetical protein
MVVEEARTRGFEKVEMEGGPNGEQESRKGKEEGVLGGHWS